MKKKLIEVALPLEAINREAAREKSIRHGHPSTLHLWWARRPLAACRAVLFSQLVDDPSAHPDRFPTEAAQEAERERLFGIIEKLVKWESTTDEVVLEEARAEIRASVGDDPPPVLDPFAGGGSIPLEAQRLGLRAIASDLNPVAVLINKALIEIPPRWSDRPPVHPSDGGRLGTETWRGAQGLADDVRHYGQWMRDQAEARIGHLYPKATLPDGSQATVIAWIWARTVTCPNPACGAQAPLVRSFWLGKKKGKEAWVRPVVEGKAVRFEIGSGPDGPPVEGTVGRSGATCLVCDEPIPLAYVRAEGRAGRLGAELMATVAEGERQRVYLAPTVEHEQAAAVPRPADVPESDLPGKALGFRVQAYGMTRHADLFTNRQLTALTTFSDLVGEARTEILSDAKAAGLTSDDAEAYGDSLSTYLAFLVSKLADLGNALCRWEPNAECPRQLFARQAIPMVWDYGEGNPLSSSSGSMTVLVRNQVRAMSNSLFSDASKSCELGKVRVTEAQAAISELPTKAILCTDPPYYDNIGYADLADFFYIWLRHSLREVYPDLLRTMLTPKVEELVADPHRFGGADAAAKHFEEGFVRTFAAAREHQAEGIPLTVFYAFKQSETDPGDGAVASTGWETMLEGLISAGLMVTATWPMRTEASNRMRGQGSNALASSIVLACRPIPDTAGITDRRGFLQALRAELPQALREMQLGSIAPVDLAQSAIGPGMAVFSRYAKVLEPSGERMRVRTALGLINQVLDEVLSEQEGDFDPETRWAVKWFAEHGHDDGPFGDANTLASARGTAVDGLVRSGILASGGGKVSLLSREDLPEDWDPATDDRVPVWEATQHLIKRLESGGEAAAAELLRRLGGIGDSAHLLAYRLYAICSDQRPKEAGPYNALVTSWPEISRMAAQVSSAANEQQTFSGE